MTSPSNALARDAVRMTILNAAANALLLVGNAYAARCLGPVNVGIGAQVVVTVQQAGIAFNGGLDTTSVRLIASGEASAREVARAVLAFRLSIALPLSLAWVLWVLAAQPPGPVRTAWLLGAPLLLLASMQLQFLFQGLERMPRWAGFSALGAALVAGTIAVSFHPGMPVGSDLWVLVGTGTLVTAISVAHGLRLARTAGGTSASSVRLRWLVGRSWRYWLLAVLVFFYTAFPVLLLAKLQGDAEAGVLRVCLQLATGLELIFASINSLLLARLVRWRRDGDAVLLAQQRRILRGHLLVGVAVLFLACAAAPFVFGHLLGPAFAAGLLPFLVLAAGRLAVFVGQIFVWSVVALGRDAALLAATIAGTATSLAFNLVLVPRYSVMGAAVANLAAEVVIGAWCYAIQRRHFTGTPSRAAYD